MNDRELLEMAAKAAGIEIDDVGAPFVRNYSDEYGNTCDDWNPLTDDGDALRLAVKLGLIIHTDGRGIMVCRTRILGEPYGNSILAAETEYHVEGRDDYAKVRRAVVRAAAEIGKAMP